LSRKKFDAGENSPSSPRRMFPLPSLTSAAPNAIDPLPKENIYGQLKISFSNLNISILPSLKKSNRPHSLQLQNPPELGILSTSSSIDFGLLSNRS